MINRIELKNEAKQKLNGRLGEAIKIIVILLLISFVTGFIAGFIMEMLNINNKSPLGQIITNLLSLIINGLFSFGVLSFYVKISRGQETTYNELFSKTDMFLKYIIISILVGIVTSIGYFLLIVPGIILTLGLSFTMYIILDNPEIGTIDAMQKSWNMMKGYKTEYFILCLSFIGWIILGIFTFGILYFWLIPYMSITQAEFYNKIKELYDQKNIG